MAVGSHYPSDCVISTDTESRLDSDSPAKNCYNGGTEESFGVFFNFSFLQMELPPSWNFWVSAFGVWPHEMHTPCKSTTDFSSLTTSHIPHPPTRTTLGIFRSHTSSIRHPLQLAILETNRCYFLSPGTLRVTIQKHNIDNSSTWVNKSCISNEKKWHFNGLFIYW